MLFFRQLQHLLPDSIAWRPRNIDSELEVGDDVTVGTGLVGQERPAGSKLWRFLSGFEGIAEDAVAFLDGIFGDIFPSTTRELGEFEKQFGLTSSVDAGSRIQNLQAAWQATGGQSPRYLQDSLQAAGFPVYVHEWWHPGPGFRQIQCSDVDAECGEPTAQAGGDSFRRFTRDPRVYTVQPLSGTRQCNDTLVACGEPSAQCDGFLVNEPGYLVNDALTDDAPPPVPDDPLKWRYFLYVGDATFPNYANVDIERRAEFERLLLKLRPAQNWVVTRINYT